MVQQVNLGMIGGGTVGSGVYHALALNGALMASRIGVKANVRKIAVKAFDEPRPYEIPRSLMTTDWQMVVNDPDIHIVIELVGCTTLARTIILWVNPKHIHVEGIRHITTLDIKFAEQLGYTIKLLGIIKTVRKSRAGKKRSQNGSRIQVSVYPTLVPNSHVLASVNHVFNAVFVRGDVVGDTLFYGRGAGKDATASAVLSDIADAALDLKFGTKHRVPPFVPHELDGAVAPIEEIVSRYFVRLDVVDVPGTLAKIATIFGDA